MPAFRQETPHFARKKAATSIGSPLFEGIQNELLPHRLCFGQNHRVLERHLERMRRRAVTER